MNAWHDAIHDLCLGRRKPSELACALYGRDDPTLRARLGSYRRSALLGEASKLATQHPQTRAVVDALACMGGWVPLCEAFLAAHPPLQSRALLDLGPLPAWLRAREQLPPWLADLAHLEQASLQAQLAPDTRVRALAPGASLVRVHSDVLEWNEAGADPHAPPTVAERIVLTWRDPTLEVQQAETGAFEAFVVERLLLDADVPHDAELAAFERDREDYEVFLELLTQLGVLLVHGSHVDESPLHSTP